MKPASYDPETIKTLQRALDLAWDALSAERRQQDQPGGARRTDPDAGGERRTRSCAAEGRCHY